MSNTRAVHVVLLLVPLLSLTGSWTNAEDDTAPQRYSSPEAVFDVYRVALAKRDWRKCFYLGTPKFQDDRVYEAYVLCRLFRSKEGLAVVRKYLVNGATINDEYNRKYKDKHGIDLASLVAEHGDDPLFRFPEPDDDLLGDVVAAHIKDKPAFYSAVCDLFEHNRPFEELKQVVVKADTRRGAK